MLLLHMRTTSSLRLVALLTAGSVGLATQGSMELSELTQGREFPGSELPDGQPCGSATVAINADQMATAATEFFSIADRAGSFAYVLPTVLNDAHGRPGMMLATEANQAHVRKQIDDVAPDGGSEQRPALRSAFAEHPEILFFLTDADIMTSDDVKPILAEANKTRIHVIHLGRGKAPAESPLHMLAAGAGGIYRYFDVRELPQP